MLLPLTTTFVAGKSNRATLQRQQALGTNIVRGTSVPNAALTRALQKALAAHPRFFGVAALGSHGCVRSATEDAEKMFEWAPVGTKVLVERA